MVKEIDVDLCRLKVETFEIMFALYILGTAFLFVQLLFCFRYTSSKLFVQLKVEVMVGLGTY